MGVTREPSVAVVTRASPGTAANVGAVRSSAQPWLHRVAATVLTVAALRLLYTLSLAERLGSDASLIGTIGGMTTSFLVALGAYGASKWTPPTIVRWRVIAGVYLTWWAVVLFALKANPVTAARSDVLATALFFRSFDSPVATLSIGLVAQSVVLLMVASPLLRNLASRVRLGAGAFAGVGGLALHALLAAWQSGPAGWHSTIIGQLPLVGGGVAVAVLEPHVRRAHRLACGFVALVAIAVAALTLPDPLRLDGSVERTLFLALAAVASTATLVGLSLDRTGVRGTAGSFPWWAAVATLCAADACAVVVARQYRERYIGSADLPVLNGRVIAPALWAAGAAVCIGVLIAAGGAVIRSARRRTLPALATHSMTLPTLLAGAFAVRLATLLTVAPERTDQGDPFFYHVTANALAAGKGFVEPFNWVAYGDPIPSAFHGPLYPMVLSISSRLGGTDYFDHKMASVVIGTALIGAVFVLARRLAGPWVAVVAASFAAVYPNLWLIDSLLYPEGLMALLVTLSIIVMYKWLDAPKVTTAVMLGALIALAALARGEGVLLGPLMAMPMMLRQRSLPLGIRWRHLVLAGLACVATLAPWMIRNTMRFDNFVPLSNNGNEVMVYSNCATAYDGPLVGYWDYTCQQRIRDEIGNPPGDESDIALYWRDIGFDYARENADELPGVASMGTLPTRAERHSGRHRGKKQGGWGTRAADVLRTCCAHRGRSAHHAPPRHPIVALDRAAGVGDDHLRVHVRHHSISRPGRTCVVRRGSHRRRAARTAGLDMAAHPGSASCDGTGPAVRVRRSRRAAGAPSRNVAARCRADVGGYRRRHACRRHPAARVVPHDGRDDGRSVHAGLPGTDVAGRHAQS
jgi:hypothetical protein